MGVEDPPAFYSGLTIMQKTKILVYLYLLFVGIGLSYLPVLYGMETLSWPMLVFFGLQSSCSLLWMLAGRDALNNSRYLLGPLAGFMLTGLLLDPGHWDTWLVVWGAMIPANTMVQDAMWQIARLLPTESDARSKL